MPSLKVKNKSSRITLSSICIYIYIYDFKVWLYVCLSVNPSLPLVRFGQLSRYTDKRIVNIVKVYDAAKSVDFIHDYFCEATDPMQYRPPNANLDSGCQTVSIVTGDNGCMSGC